MTGEEADSAIKELSKHGYVFARFPDREGPDGLLKRVREAFKGVVCIAIASAPDRRPAPEGAPGQAKAKPKAPDGTQPPDVLLIASSPTMEEVDILA